MINKIKANITKNHKFICDVNTIGRAGENECTELEMVLCENLINSWVYLDFISPDGSKYKTPRLEIVNNIVNYAIPNLVLCDKGILTIQMIAHSEEGIIWETDVKEFYVKESINAVDEIENKEDFITEAQTLLDEIENGLTPTIGENENWFICNKDTGKPSRGLKGDDYVITDKDYETIEANVKSDIQPILEEIENTSKQAEIIAKGRATGYVFDTVEELDNWLLVEENVAKLVLGDNLYIRTVGVPDYWWDGTSKQVLETEKPDLTEYAKKEQFVTLTQAEYDALETKSANTYYFIPEEE